MELTSDDKSLFTKAGVFYEKGDIKKAVDILADLVERYPNSALLNASLANGYWDLENYSRADHFFEIAVQCEQQLEKVSLGYFHFLWDTDQKERAVEEIERYAKRSELSDHYLEIVNDINSNSPYTVQIL